MAPEPSALPDDFAQALAQAIVTTQPAPPEPAAPAASAGVPSLGGPPSAGGAPFEAQAEQQQGAPLPPPGVQQPWAAPVEPAGAAGKPKLKLKVGGGAPAPAAPPREPSREPARRLLLRCAVCTVASAGSVHVAGELQRA